MGPADVTRPLIVNAEDDADIRELIRLVVEHAGYRVVGASNGDEAFAAAEEEAPALFLLDLQMPRMNGIATARALREDPRFSDIPIVLLTADASETRGIDAAEIGVTLIVQKPVLPNDLVKAVDAVLGRKR